MIRINLLGAEADKQSKGGGFQLPDFGANATQVGIGALLISVLLLLVAAWWYQTARLDDVRTQLVEIESERSRLETVAERVEELQGQTDILREKLNVIVELKASQTGPVMLLDQVSRSLTDGLWMTELELEEGEVRMQGASLSDASVADFVNNLERSEYFADVRIRTLLDSGEQSNFRITLIFDPTPGAREESGGEGEEGGRD